MATEMTVPTSTDRLSVELVSDTEVCVTRVFNAPRRLVFEAWTRCEHLKQWLLGPDGWTMPDCRVDPRPGGEWYHLWRGPDGTEFSMHGQYQEVVPYERIVNTEIYMEGPPAVDTLIFSEENGRTTAAMTIRYVSKDVRDMVLATGMTDGMADSYDRLEAYLAGRS